MKWVYNLPVPGLLLSNESRIEYDLEPGRSVLLTFLIQESYG